MGLSAIVSFFSGDLKHRSIKKVYGNNERKTGAWITKKDSYGEVSPDRKISGALIPGGIAD